MRGTFAASDLASTETVTIEPAERQGRRNGWRCGFGRRRRRQQYFRVVALRPTVVAVAPEVRFQPLSPAAVVARDLGAQAAQAPLPAEPEGFRPQRATGLVGKASLARQQSRRPRTRIGAGLAVRALPRRRWLHRWGSSIRGGGGGGAGGRDSATPAVVAGGAGGRSGAYRLAAAGLSERTALHPRQARLARLPTQVAADTAVVVAARPSRHRRPAAAGGAGGAGGGGGGGGGAGMNPGVAALEVWAASATQSSIRGDACQARAACRGRGTSSQAATEGAGAHIRRVTNQDQGTPRSSSPPHSFSRGRQTPLAVARERNAERCFCEQSGHHCRRLVGRHSRSWRDSIAA